MIMKDIRWFGGLIGIFREKRT